MSGMGPTLSLVWRRFLTPDDVSKTYVRTVGNMSDLLGWTAWQNDNNKIAGRAAMLLVQGVVGSHYGVISALIQGWTRDDDKYAVDYDRPLLGRGSLLWQELDNRAESNDFWGRVDMLAVWPKEAGDRRLDLGQLATAMTCMTITTIATWLLISQSDKKFATSASRKRDNIPPNNCE